MSIITTSKKFLKSVKNDLVIKDMHKQCIAKISNLEGIMIFENFIQ